MITIINLYYIKKMNEKNNNNEDLNSSFNLNTTNTNTNNRYPSLPPFNNSNVVEINRHQDMLYYLRQIADNTREIRRAEGDNSIVNFSIIFLVFLFFIYMLIQYYTLNGFSYPVANKLLGMLLALFIMVVIIHRRDVNLINKFKDNSSK